MAVRKESLDGKLARARARLRQIWMDDSVNASLDSKDRYVRLVYRQSRRTSVWAFCRACRGEGLRRDAHYDVPDNNATSLRVRRNVNTFASKGATGIKIFVATKNFRTWLRT